jgi:DNA-binding NarL/FixJ family response regulator
MARNDEMRVLLADDQVWLRSALRLLLEHETNIEVVGEAENLRALPPTVNRLRPDLIFLDWQLPGIDTNGARRRLLDALRLLHPHLYIVALINDDNTTSSQLLGADAYVNKAEPPERIASVLRRAVCKMTARTGSMPEDRP